MKYKVSIIIPVYNCISFLKRAVESVINQKDFIENELILIDDGSTDGSASVCDAFSKDFDNIKVIHQTNNGVSSARNTGIDIAQGEWIFFLDSDDYLLEDTFEKMFINGDADIVCASYETNVGFPSSFQDELKYGCYNKSEIANELNHILASSNNFFYTCWAKLFKRSIIQKFNISFPIGRKYAEDMVFVYDYLKHCENISLVKESVYYYYINPDNATSVIPKSFETVQFVFLWKKKYFDEMISYDDEIERLNIITFLNSAVSSIKTAATYLTGYDSINYISYILRDDDFKKLYTQSIANNTFNTSSDRILDKLIRRNCPIFIYLLFKLLKIKSFLNKF